MSSNNEINRSPLSPFSESLSSNSDSFEAKQHSGGIELQDGDDLGTRNMVEFALENDEEALLDHFCRRGTSDKDPTEHARSVLLQLLIKNMVASGELVVDGFEEGIPILSRGHVAHFNKGPIQTFDRENEKIEKLKKKRERKNREKNVKSVTQEGSKNDTYDINKVLKELGVGDGDASARIKKGSKK
jgi:hypothetical protein